MQTQIVDDLVTELGVLATQVRAVEAEVPQIPETHLAQLALQTATAAVLDAIYAVPDEIEVAVTHAQQQIERARQFATAASRMVDDARRMRKSLRERMARTWKLPPDGDAP